MYAPGRDVTIVTMPGTLGEAIHDLRTRRGLSQGAFARAAGCSRSFLSLLESGRRAAVTLPLAHRSRKPWVCPSLPW